jgi:hypothetical protein
MEFKELKFISFEDKKKWIEFEFKNLFLDKKFIIFCHSNSVNNIKMIKIRRKLKDANLSLKLLNGNIIYRILRDKFQFTSKELSSFALVYWDKIEKENNAFQSFRDLIKLKLEVEFIPLCIFLENYFLSIEMFLELEKIHKWILVRNLYYLIELYINLLNKSHIDFFFLLNLNKNI